MRNGFENLEDSYRILDVPYTATEGDIKEKYRFLAASFHPDKYGSSESYRKMGEDKLKEINAARDNILAAMKAGVKPQVRADNAGSKAEKEYDKPRKEYWREEYMRKEKKATLSERWWEYFSGYAGVTLTKEERKNTGFFELCRMFLYGY